MGPMLFVFVGLVQRRVIRMKVKNTKLGQQILDTFAAVPLDVLGKKSVEFVCSLLQKCMHSG